MFKLRKAFYGLKQVSGPWYSKIDHFFNQHGFESSANEPTLCMKKEKGINDQLLVCLHVDDIIYSSSSQNLIAKLKIGIRNTFEMSDLGLM